jgi:transposase
VRRVVVVSPDDTGIRQARAKTDRLDARTLARLLAAGELDAVWVPDERCRLLRRRLARREQLVRARSRAKNEIHAVLMRRLKGKPPVSDLFGVRGRRWLSELELPVEEAETVASALRHVEFLDGEIAAVERLIAREALRSADARRLMTVPGVNVICAATFLAAVGDIRRFRTAAALVGYLGLDPRVRQSGSEPAKGGRISKRGSASARWVLVEAAWSVVQQPGPMHAFYERLRARRGHGKAVVAVARKLAALFWCLLTRGEDYAHQQPSLTAKKLRLVEIRAGAPTVRGKRTGTWATRQQMRQAERALAQQAEASYTRMVSDWQAARPATPKPAGPNEVGASVTPGAHQGPRRATSRGRPRAPDVCASTRPRLAPTRSLTAHRLLATTPPAAGADRARPKPAESRRTAAARPKPRPQEADLRPSETRPRLTRRPKSSRIASRALDFLTEKVPGSGR